MSGVGLLKKRDEIKAKQNKELKEYFLKMFTIILCIGTCFVVLKLSFEHDDVVLNIFSFLVLQTCIAVGILISIKDMFENLKKGGVE